jgi:hypothetical protein
MAGGNGGQNEVPIGIPAKTDYLVHRHEADGGNVIVRAHGVGISKGGILAFSEISMDTNQQGEPYLIQRNVRLFRFWDDVELIDIPATPSATRH